MNFNSQNSSEFIIEYTKAADKFLRTHEDIREHYEEDIRCLISGDGSRNVDIKKIKGRFNDYYRIRIGSCRIIFAVINGKIVVISTLLAGPRGDVYKKMDGIR